MTPYKPKDHYINYIISSTQGIFTSDDMLIAFCICPPLNSYPYLASRITTSAMFDWPSFNSRANDWTDMYLNLALGPGITSNACFDEKSPINFESVFSSFLKRF